jgi:hypothetical protein
MRPFRFEARLFEHRNHVLETLAHHGYCWLVDFGSVDTAHDVYGLEVCGIREEAASERIELLLIELFPDWLYERRYFEDENLGELGWKVLISRDPEDFDDPWKADG